jgi:hypothetical protein
MGIMDTSATDSATVCFVLKSRSYAERRHIDIEYPPLPEGARAELEAIAACQRHPLLIAPDELHTIRERHGLPGVALVQTVQGKHELTIPSPTLVPFEAIELDETHPAIEALLSPEARGHAPLPDVPARSRYWQHTLRAIILVAPLYAGLILLARVSTPSLWSWPDTMLFALPGGLALVSALLLLAFPVRGRSGLRWAPRWYLVPGGVALRRRAPLPLRKRWRLYTPRDTVLTITPLRSGWQAALDRGGVQIVHGFTSLECAALLAAWQSPLPAPSVELLQQLG